MHNFSSRFDRITIAFKSSAELLNAMHTMDFHPVSNALEWCAGVSTIMQNLPPLSPHNFYAHIADVSPHQMGMKLPPGLALFSLHSKNH